MHIVHAGHYKICVLLHEFAYILGENCQIKTRLYLQGYEPKMSQHHETRPLRYNQLCLAHKKKIKRNKFSASSPTNLFS